MNQFLFILLSILFISSCSVADTQKKVKLKVLTFNILGGRNVDGKRDVTRLAKIIKVLDPDIVAMQEVDKGTKRIQGRDTTAELAKLCGMHHAFGKAMNFGGGQYGEAVLSKYPIKSVANFSLPAEKGAEPRAALTVTVNIPGTEIDYLFIATHLDHLSKDTNRIMQAKKLNEIMSAQEGLFIIAGDMNAEPGSKTIKILSEKAKFTPEPMHLPTYSSDNPKVKIDWIGTDKSGHWKLQESITADRLKNAPEGWKELLLISTDHFPLMNTYEYLKNHK